MCACENYNFPEVSIVLPVFNGERFLRAALDSLLAQTFGDFELLISDNASTDSTPLICREYVERDVRVKYFKQPDNIGVFANTEWLYKRARGKFLMLVGDDDIYEPDCLERYVSRISNNDDVIVVYSDYGWIDAEGKIYSSGLKDFMRATDSIEKNLCLFIRNPLALPMMMGLFRTSIVQSALPFPVYGDRYRNVTGSRDVGFLWRILPQGRVDSIQKPLFFYRIKERSNIGFDGLDSRSFKLRMHVAHLNFIILKEHIFTSIWKQNSRISLKFLLSLWAAIVFCGRYIILPIWYKVFPRR